MAKERSGPTMADVAREAGVALGTVSRVVNGEQVGEEYKNKVLSAIQRLGYHYNISGRALRTDRTNTIAFIIPNTINPYFALLVHHVNLALEKRNYKMMLCFSEYDQGREIEYIQMAQQNRVDGIIALTYNPHLSIPEDIPFVTIDRFFSVSVPCIASDNFGGGRMAAKKLYELGCRRVAFMRVGSTLTNEPSKRKDGFVSACVDLGMPFEVMALEDGAPFDEFVRFLTDHMQNGRLTFDGLFLGTDMLAWQICQVLKRMGVRIPEDVQVIGFDGIRMFGDQAYVTSTIVQPVQEIAEACVSTVLSKHLSNVPSLICLPVSYASGGTTRE
ncbi:MAG: LacI family DNA-binding transcriptional regulator [Clostridia bacterium]|nr:LacI family DNA-binding transcriptional regulator [Clostridia bacterium]